MKVQTSGGTTGKPRPTLYGADEWELNGLTMARDALHLSACAPATVFKSRTPARSATPAGAATRPAHDYLGALPLTTGTGAVTSSRRQIEIAQEWGTNVWYVRPEYSTQLAKVARDELKFDLRELKTKFLGCGLGPDIDDAFAKQIEELWGCAGLRHVRHARNGHGLPSSAGTRTACISMEDCTFFEIVDVETTKPVPNGRSATWCAPSCIAASMPMIRFNLRDLTKIVATDRCECGSCFRRMQKMLGRSDTMVRIRGVSIWPQACLPAIKSDPRTTGEWLCIAERNERDGVVRDEMTVQVEVRDDAGGWDGLKEHIEKRLHSDLGLKLDVELVKEDALIEWSNRGREGKPKRIIDRRREDDAYATKQKGLTMRYFDCHSHFSTQRGPASRDAGGLRATRSACSSASATFETEEEMADGFRRATCAPFSTSTAPGA